MSPCLNFTLYSDHRAPWNWWRNDVRKLTRLCQEFAGSHYSIDILDLAQERERAFHDGVYATPAILLELAGGRKQNLGNFAQARKFLERLKSQATFLEERVQSLDREKPLLHAEVPFRFHAPANSSGLDSGSLSALKAAGKLVKVNLNRGSIGLGELRSTGGCTSANPTPGFHPVK